jgi:hypothetical protein
MLMVSAQRSSSNEQIGIDAAYNLACVKHTGYDLRSFKMSMGEGPQKGEERPEKS